MNISMADVLLTLLASTSFTRVPREPPPPPPPVEEMVMTLPTVFSTTLDPAAIVIAPVKLLSEVEPGKVQVVVVQLAPDPNVKAPGVPLMLATPVELAAEIWMLLPEGVRVTLVPAVSVTAPVMVLREVTPPPPPPPPVAAMVTVLPEGVRVMLAPAAKLTAPVRELTEDTPEGVEAIVSVLPEGVTVMLAPAAMVRLPARLLRVSTPLVGGVWHTGTKVLLIPVMKPPPTQVWLAVPRTKSPGVNVLLPVQTLLRPSVGRVFWQDPVIPRIANAMHVISLFN